MTGSNEIRLNQASMNEAVEYWLRSKVLQAGVRFKVIGVEKENKAYATEFVVKLEEDASSKSEEKAP